MEVIRQLMSQQIVTITSTYVAVSTLYPCNSQCEEHWGSYPFVHVFFFQLIYSRGIHSPAFANQSLQRSTALWSHIRYCFDLRRWDSPTWKWSWLRSRNNLCCWCLPFSLHFVDPCPHNCKVPWAKIRRGRWLSFRTDYERVAEEASLLESVYVDKFHCDCHFRFGLFDRGC